MIKPIKFEVELADYDNIREHIHLTQYDRGFNIEISILEHGLPYTLQNDEAIQIDFELPKNNGYIISKESINIIDSNTISFAVNRNITLNSGIAKFNIAVIDKTTGITKKKSSNQYTIDIAPNSLSEDFINEELIVSAKEGLDESIEIAQDLISQSQSTANPSYTIKVTDWTSTTIDGMSVYTYTLTHNLNTTNIIVSVYDSENDNIDLPFKIINNNSIQFKTFEKEAFKVIVSANYQAVAGTLASAIATEVEDARGSYGTLDNRLDNIDTAITTKTETLDNKITTTKTELEQLISTSILEHDKNVTYAVGKPYISFTDSRNPSEILGFGTWELTAQGKTLIGVNPNDTDFNVVGKTGGSKTHNHGSGEIIANIGAIEQNIGMIGYDAVGARKPFYNMGIVGTRGLTSDDIHVVNHATSTSGNTANASSLQPYITCYIWKRTA